jgi:hypothetical protein
MKILVLTSPSYTYLMDGFDLQWKKFSGHPYHTLVTEQNDWNGSIVRYLQSIENKSVLVVLEDYWLNGETNPYKLQLAEAVIDYGFAQKVDLQYQVKHWPHIDFSDTVLEATQDALYRRSLQAAVWNREYLIKCCSEARGQSPWEFETKHGIRDGVRILGFKEPAMSYANVMLKGEPDKFQWSKLSPQDQLELNALGYTKW